MCMAHFSLLKFIPASWLYILIFCIRVSKSFSFFKRVGVIHVLEVITLFFRSCKCITPSDLICVFERHYRKLVMVKAHVFGISLSGFSALRMFYSSSKSHFSIFHDFLEEFYLYAWYYVPFQTISMWDHIIGLFVINPHHSYIFRHILLSLRMYGSVYSKSPVTLVPLWNPFTFSVLARNRPPISSVLLGFSTL